jgi:hypothetical protein
MRMLLLHGTMLLVPLVLATLNAVIRGQLPGFCLFRWATGIDCPACGITRSLMAAFSGNVMESFRFHPAGLFVLLLLALMTAYFAVVLLARGAGMEWRKEVRAYRWLDGVAITTLLLGWIGKSLVHLL